MLVIEESVIFILISVARGEEKRRIKVWDGWMVGLLFSCWPIVIKNKKRNNCNIEKELEKRRWLFFLRLMTF